MAKKTKTTTEAPATIPIAEAKTKKASAPAKAKPPAKKGKPVKEKRLSALDAAAKVLAESGTPMTSGELIEAMAKRNLWSSPNGQTPAATLYAAMIREIGKKGKDSRFAKSERGKFEATGKQTARPRFAALRGLTATPGSPLRRHLQPARCNRRIAATRRDSRHSVPDDCQHGAVQAHPRSQVFRRRTN
jgi:hypothetical protein